MARLRRLAHRLVWVNPLKGSPRYEPLARGMAAALPSDRRVPVRAQPRAPRGARLACSAGRLAGVIDDDELTGAGDLDGEDPLPRSNRGFWIVATSLALVCILMAIAIVANRPLKNTIGHTESDLNAALLHAQRVQSSSGGSRRRRRFARRRRWGAGLRRSRRASSGPGSVSVFASASVWAAAVQARPQACFFIKQVIGEDTAYGVATGECTGPRGAERQQRSVVSRA